VTRVRWSALAVATILALSARILDAQTDSASSVKVADTTGMRRRWLFLPGADWAPETGFEAAFTVITIATPKRDTLARPTTLSFYVLRSVKAQTRASFDGERWLPGNKARLQGSLSIVEYPYSFFGIGDRTTRSQEEKYLPRWIEGYVQMDRQVIPHWYVVLGWRAGYEEVRPKSPGLLQDQLVPGSRITRTLIGTLGATYDSRDNVVSSYHGQLFSLAYGASNRVLGVTYSYGRLDAEWRGFMDLGGHNVLAANAAVAGVDGTVPFDQLPVIGGGHIMRGYSAGRFRDRWVTAAQAEYRSPMVFERIGAIAFVGVGAAAPNPGDLGRARPFPSAGIGGRLQVDKLQRTALRLDYAFGAYGFGGLYLGFNQAF